MEKLIIRNFLEIEKIELSVNKFNILIGPQASGKSIIAKLLFYSKSLFQEIHDSVLNDDTKGDLKKKLRDKFSEIFPRSSWNETTFYIDYRYNDYKFQISNKTMDNKSFKIDFISGYDVLWDKVKEEKNKIVERISVADNLFPKFDSNSEKLFTNTIRKSFDGIDHYEQLYIPAGRSFFSLLQSNIFSILSNNSNIDLFLKQFGSFYETLKVIDIQKDNPQQELIKLSEEILLGDFVREKGKDYLKLNNGRKLNLAYCSSGQQEVLPLIITLKAIQKTSVVNDGLTLYIEEPEAHLFPLAQKKIVEMMIRVFNKVNPKIQFFITTHSPYVLTSTNNYLLAGTFDKKEKESKFEQLNSIIDVETILNPKSLSAFSIIDGKLNSIIDNETEIISADLIDTVSTDLEMQFDKILDIMDYEN
ncbi:ATP-binding protein [Marinilabiliaceae bacterium JC040]|nr:ATP-binding protein [Marinilabiliaceae bacterium JC040]